VVGVDVAHAWSSYAFARDRYRHGRTLVIRRGREIITIRRGVQHKMAPSGSERRMG